MCCGARICCGDSFWCCEFVAEPAVCDVQLFLLTHLNLLRTQLIFGEEAEFVEERAFCAEQPEFAGVSFLLCSQGACILS